MKAKKGAFMFLFFLTIFILFFVGVYFESITEGNGNQLLGQVGPITQWMNKGILNET